MSPLTSTLITKEFGVQLTFLIKSSARWEAFLLLHLFIRSTCVYFRVIQALSVHKDILEPAKAYPETCLCPQVVTAVPV